MADGTVDTLKIVVNWDDKTARAGMEKMARLLEKIDTVSKGTANSMSNIETAAATAENKTEQAYTAVAQAVQSATREHEGMTAALREEKATATAASQSEKEALVDNASRADILNAKLETVNDRIAKALNPDSNATTGYLATLVEKAQRLEAELDKVNSTNVFSSLGESAKKALVENTTRAEILKAKLADVKVQLEQALNTESTATEGQIASLIEKAQKLQAQLDKVNTPIEKTEDVSTNAAKAALLENASQADILNAKLADVNDSLQKALGNNSKVTIGQFATLVEKSQKLQTELGKVNTEIEKTEDVSKKAAKAALVENASQTDILKAKLADVNDSLQKALGNDSKATVGQVASLVEKSQKLQSQLDKINAEIAKTTPELEKTSAELDKTSKTSAFTRLGAAVKKATGSVSTLLSAITRIAFYRAIRALIKGITNAIKTGVNDLYQWSKAMNGEFASAMDRASTSMLYFKNAIGTVLEPFLMRLIPVLEKVTDAIVDMMNEWNQAVAYLQGRDTFTRALKVPKAYAEAANDATKANEKLKRSILGFDEINKLDDKTDTAAANGAKNLDYSSMFVTESANADIPTPIVDTWNSWFDFIEQGWLDFFDQVDTWWNNLPGKVNTWLEEIGTNVYNWLTELGGNFIIGLVKLGGSVTTWLIRAGGKLLVWLIKLGGSISEWFNLLWTNFKSWLNTLWTGFSGFFVMLWQNISGFFVNLWNGITSWATALWQTLTSWWTFIVGLFTGNFDKIKEGWNGFWGGLWGMLKAWLNFIIGGVEWLVNCIVNGVNWIINTLNSFHFKLPDWLGGYEVGFNIKLIPQVKIPRLADGGIVADGQLFIANEAGPELIGNYGGKSAVMNNAQIVDAVAGGVRDANAEQNALLREQNNLLRELLTTGFTSTISTDSLVSGLNRKNRRDGRTVVPVGV